ncbi:hypothetical protein Sar04_48340 [Salinispora arenicola]|uniref:Repeat uncharacterized protein DUF346 n=1 Tax=Salinispora arenicola TaxID=168697 RepID=A0A542XLJ4_SALAC|nr:repeat uncharacterized protein DUF346 [Salinispora arenicola]GIM88098.1 hypothetical protein Sar04_48340 [Salinispora arenicola]
MNAKISPKTATRQRSTTTGVIGDAPYLDPQSVRQQPSGSPEVEQVVNEQPAHARRLDAAAVGTPRRGGSRACAGKTFRSGSRPDRRPSSGSPSLHHCGVPGRRTMWPHHVFYRLSNGTLEHRFVDDTTGQVVTDNWGG